MIENTNAELTHIFLSMAAMWPSQINAAWPGAQFVARGRVPVSDAPIAVYFSQVIEDDVWGLIVATPSVPDRENVSTAVADDGRTFEVSLATAELLSGDPQELLAAARYWELPPRFVAQLRQALQSGGIVVEDEEPRDDGNLG